MSKSKLKDYWDSFRKETIECILNIIRERGEIHDVVLISTIAVEPPFLNNKKAEEVLNNLKNAGKIAVDEKGMVSICQ